MSRDYSFSDSLAFSKGNRRETTEETIKSMLYGCVAVRDSTRQEEKVGVDYVATLRGGAMVLIDEKTRRPGCRRYWRHGQPEVALEIWSVRPEPERGIRGVAGWTLSESKVTDMVLYTWDPQDCQSCYLLPFQHLRMAFVKNFAHWRSLFDDPKQTTDGGRYGSQTVLVPIDLVLDAIIDVSRRAPDYKDIQGEMFS